MEAERRGAAVGDDVEAELAARPLDAPVRLAGLGAQRERDVGLVRPRREAIQRLADDARGLAHLLEAHEEAVVGVAVAAHGDVEVHAVVDAVRLGLAEVPRHAGAAQHRPAERAVDRVLRRDRADAAAAREQDLVVDEQFGVLVDALRHVVDERLDGGEELRGRVEGDAADPHVVRGEPRAAGHLEQVEDALALAEHVHQRRLPRARVVDERAVGHRVAGDALQLGEDHAQVRRPLRHLDAGEELDGEAVAEVAAHGGEVVGAVGEGDVLGVGALLGELLHRAVEVADDHVHVLDALAVHDDAQAEHAVRRGVLGPDVEDVRLGRGGHRACTPGSSNGNLGRPGWWSGIWRKSLRSGKPG